MKKKTQQKKLQQAEEQAKAAVRQGEAEQTQPKSEMEAKIDSAMEKIIQDTIGSQAEAAAYQEPDKKTIKMQKKAAKKEMRAEEKKGKKTGIKIALGITGAVVILAAAGYGAGAYYYKDKFFKGTTVNHIACGNLTVEQAEDLIRKKVEDYSIQVQFRNDQTREIKGQDIGYAYVSDGSVQKLLDEQNPFTWIKGYFRDTDHEAEENIQYDKEALKAQLQSFDCMQAASMEAPADAYIAFQENQFVIVDETAGTTVQEDIILSALEQAVAGSEESVSAEEAGSYAAPAVTKEDPTLNHQRDVWNSCAAVTITYTFGDKTEVLDGMTVKEWMTYDENGNYVEDPATLEARVTEFVAWLADNYDTVGRDRTITSTATGEPITVSGGNYGFQINQLKEKAQLLEDIASHAVTVREPVYSKAGVAYGENDIGGTYVEIDLTSQHLWFYKDGALLMDTDLVSGTYVMRDRRTPGGVYSLMYKQRNQVLRGRKLEDGTYEYEQPVKYWMPFNGGIGLHDANWRYSFGGSIYRTSGSHGCINLPTAAATTIYENIEAGCPVVCFYRE